MTKPKIYEYSSEEIIEALTQRLGELVIRRHQKKEAVSLLEIEQLDKFLKMAVTIRKEEREAAMDDAASKLSNVSGGRVDPKILMDHLQKKYGT